jgi:hypothetical protein
MEKDRNEDENCEEFVSLSVGCDRRSEFQNWCAGAGNHRSS